ncbi:MAG: hypothetical protein UT63_C0115G0008 [Candidatus Gottesmanbacteria bacterium GW2011_GWC2_39_8]|uniref:Uncharacterized protein n=1 Tax=Candidatus Gottesmanbacteria bacterium GW2011_GWC2_39_8 TaxID=1618450 RepID=A0A0G0SW25_9BACT|nr:MAG: hypothetical protein UT63_C0115G0008 [Candidatus Gottesmanbacteria bacterium GW2011_GWC2_39_8]
MEKVFIIRAVKNEIFLSTIVGFILGLAVAAILVFAPQFLPKKMNFQLAKTETPKPTIKQSSNQKIFVQITQPTDQSLLTTNQFSVKGKTVPGALVVISGENSDLVVNADDDGNFTGDITVGEGISNIAVTAYDEKNKSSNSEVKVYYTKEKI